MEENGSTAPVDGFEAVPEGTLDGTQEVQADNSDGVFDWKEWGSRQLMVLSFARRNQL